MTFRVLDCDHVFDALTRGPFSGSGDNDSVIEAHLQNCPECRRLAEALRPAIDLMHESLPDEDLPSYQGSLPPADEDSVVSVMTKIRQVNPQPARIARESRRRVDPYSIAVAAVIGLILGVLIASPGERFENPRFALGTGTSPDSTGQALLDELQLVSACLMAPPSTSQHPDGPHFSATRPAPEAGNTASVAHYACCTQCHNIEQSHGTFFKHRRSITKLLQGCHACHKAA